MDKEKYEKIFQEVLKANRGLKSKKPYELIKKIPNDFIVEKGEIYFKLICLDNYLKNNDEQLEFINYLLENNLGIRSTLLLYKASYLAMDSTKFKNTDFIVTDQEKHEQAKKIIIDTVKQYPNYKEDINENDLFFEPLDSFPLLSDYYYGTKS